MAGLRMAKAGAATPGSRSPSNRSPVRDPDRPLQVRRRIRVIPAYEVEEAEIVILFECDPYPYTGGHSVH